MERSVSRIETAGPAQRSAATHANRPVIEPANFGAHSPFLMMMEDWFAPPAGFPTHPHRGMETVTLVLEGELEHRDHTGGHGRLGPGDVQWMTAGKGVLHSEMPGPRGVHSLQLWLNLPAANKMAKARYADQRAAEVTVVTGDGHEIRVYAGSQGGVERTHGSSYPMSLCVVKVDAGAEAKLELGSDERGFLYVLKGSTTGGLKAGQTAWLDPAGGEGTDVFTVKASEPLEAVFMSGRPIEEPVVAYGPFVMNTPDEIRQAFADYQRGELV